MQTSFANTTLQVFLKEEKNTSIGSHTINNVINTTIVEKNTTDQPLKKTFITLKDYLWTHIHSK